MVAFVSREEISIDRSNQNLYRKVEIPINYRMYQPEFTLYMRCTSTEGYSLYNIHISMRNDMLILYNRI